MKSQEKITKEMNYILANQESVQAQITQVESGIAQTEVHSSGVLIILSVFVRHLFISGYKSGVEMERGVIFPLCYKLLAVKIEERKKKKK